MVYIVNSKENSYKHPVRDLDWFIEIISQFSLIYWYQNPFLVLDIIIIELS